MKFAILCILRKNVFILVSGQTSPSIMPNNNPPNFVLDQNIPMEKRSPYNPIQGTPRPQFNTDIIQPTVYATRLDTYQPPSMQLNTSAQDKMGPAKPQENNKQLRDLLQRQESIGGLMSNPSTVLNVTTPGTQQIPGRWNNPDESSLNANQTPQFSSSTFREPFPVTLQGRNPKVINSNPNTIRMPVTTGAEMAGTNQQFHHTKMNITLDNQCDAEKKMDPTATNLVNQKMQVTGTSQGNLQHKMKVKDNMPKAMGNVGTEIPDNVTAELEKLEQEENVAIGEVEGVGDILGGLGEDDDELIKSLTAEMDFNILEYADPELDALAGGDNQNLLDKLDFDEGDPEMKKSTTEKYVFMLIWRANNFFL